MSSYKLTKIAKQDIQSINPYTVKKWGKVQAVQYVEKLYHRFEWLSENPNLGKDRSQISQGLLSYIESRHIIFYRKERDFIAILRVLHTSMDYQRHLLTDNYH